MTTPDPIDAAIAAGIATWPEELLSDGLEEHVALAAAIRAAAPILIAAGREQAAEAIEAEAEPISDDYEHVQYASAMQDAADIARGGTP